MNDRLREDANRAEIATLSLKDSTVVREFHHGEQTGTVTRKKDGGYSIIVVNNKTGQRRVEQVWPDDQIREEYIANQSRHKYPKIIQRQLKNRGFVEEGTFSPVLGRKILELPEPDLSRKDKNGHIIFPGKKVEFDEVRKAIEAYWPENFAVLPQTKTMGDFERAYPREYHAVRRHFRDFRVNSHPFNSSAELFNAIRPGIVEHIEGHHPKIRGRRFRDRKIDLAELKKSLLERYYAGKPINPTYLTRGTDSPEERRLGSNILLLARQSGLVRNSWDSFGVKAAEITGLTTDEVCIRRDEYNTWAIMLENLTYFALTWASQTPKGLEFLIRGDVLRNGGSTDFRIDGERGIADLRIKNGKLDIPVEVKSGTEIRRAVVRDRILARYTGAGIWSDGANMSMGTVITHSPSNTSERYAEELRNKGLTVIEFNDFKPIYLSAVENIKKSDYARKRVNSLFHSDFAPTMDQMYDQFVLTPNASLNPANRDKVAWFSHFFTTLARMNERPEEELFTEHTREEPPEGFTVGRNEYGEFLIGRRRLEDYLPVSYHKTIGKIESKLNNSKLLFMDCETTGTARSDLISTITFVSMRAGTQPELLAYFARNPAEETAILYELAKEADGDTKIVGYNVRGFDIDRLSKKMRQNCIRMPSNVNYNPDYERTHFAEKSIELLIAARDDRRVRQLQLPNLNLRTIEKHFLNIDRGADVSGKQFAEDYKDFIYGKKGMVKIGRGIEHGLHDVASLPVLYYKLCME